jgi:carbonic anhydrase
MDTETFFTSVGCMDGRVQKAIAELGQEKFGAQFPDTITEPGLDGMLANISEADPRLVDLIRKIEISTDKHHSRGIIVHGHQDCAGNPVDENQHMSDIKKSVEVIQKVAREKGISVIGVYVKVDPRIEIVPVV